MRNSAFLLLGLFLLFAQESLFRVPEFSLIPAWFGRPSLILPLLMFMGIRDFALVRGACLAFALGYATDLIGISPIGLCTFTSVLMFVLARAAGFRVASRSRWVQVLLSFAFSVIQSGIMVLLLRVFSPNQDSWAVSMRSAAILPHALVTALVALPVLALADVVLDRTRSERGDRDGAAAMPRVPRMRRRSAP